MTYNVLSGTLSLYTTITIFVTKTKRKLELFIFILGFKNKNY